MNLTLELFVIAVAICITIQGIRAHRRIRTYNEKYQPISDEEFLRCCSPGVTPEVALKVRRMVADILPVDYSRVHPDSRFSEISDC